MTREAPSGPNAWLFLHGFGGGERSWAEVLRLASPRSSCVPTLLGHEWNRDEAQEVPVGSGSASPAGEDRFMAEVARLGRLAVESLDAPFSVCGYSLGGRLALGLALAQPASVGRLVLVGANPGLKEDHDRVERAESDERWARMIERSGTDHFFSLWLEQPLLASQAALSPGRLSEQSAVRDSLQAGGLARAMRDLSLAGMPNFRKSLGQMSCPVDLVVGALDLKFGALAESMALSIPQCRVTKVPGVGHNVLLEAPGALAAVLKLEKPQ